MIFPGTKLPETKFPETKFPGDEISGTKLPGTKFPGTKLPNTIFQNDTETETGHLSIKDYIFNMKHNRNLTNLTMNGRPPRLKHLSTMKRGYQQFNSRHFDTKSDSSLINTSVLVLFLRLLNDLLIFHKFHHFLDPHYLI